MARLSILSAMASLLCYHARQRDIILLYLSLGSGFFLRSISGPLYVFIRIHRNTKPFNAIWIMIDEINLSLQRYKEND